MGLPFKVAQAYFEAITVIEAQSRLVDMNVSDYPKMKNEGRKKFFRDMRKMAYPEGLQNQMSFEDFISRMKEHGGRTDSNRN